jgi:hypothetical protein
MHGWSYDERHLSTLADRFPDNVVVASLPAPHAEASGYAWLPHVERGRELMRETRQRLRG